MEPGKVNRGAGGGLHSGDHVRELALAVGAQRRDGEFWVWFADHPVIVAQPTLAPWVSSVRHAGLAGGSVSRTRAEPTQVPLPRQPLEHDTSREQDRKPWTA